MVVFFKLFVLLFCCTVIDSTPIFLYSFSSLGKNEFDDKACLSIVTAILAGWQMHVVSVIKEKELALGGDFDNKLMKIYAIYEIAKNHNDNDVIFFVDAFDVVFQNDVSRFQKVYSSMDLTDKILYNVEKNCYPSSQANYNCPIFKGRAFNASTATSYPSLTCDLQKKIAPKNYPFKYLNSGVFIGSAKLVRELYEYIIQVNVDTPDRCRGDQQMVSWVYGHQSQPIVLDFDQVLLAAMAYDYPNYHFNKKRGLLIKNMTNSKHQVQPFSLHFNGGKEGYETTILKLLRWHVLRHGKTKVVSRLQKGGLYVDNVKEDFLSICNIGTILPRLSKSTRESE